jgi:hypothetical protein
MAYLIGRHALQATVNCFIDETCVLRSLPCFVDALGKAMNGIKAVNTDEYLVVDGWTSKIIARGAYTCFGARTGCSIISDI